jgi:hypothetical protein
MRTAVVYYNIYNGNCYDSDGNPLGDDTWPYIYFKEKISLELHLVTDSDLTAYTGLSATTITCEAAVDNDWNHYVAGTLSDAPSGGLTGTITDVTVSGLSSAPESKGYLKLIDSLDQTDKIYYNAVTSNSDGSYTFTVEDSLEDSSSGADLTNTYVDGDEVRVLDPLLLKSEDADVDQTDKATGKFIITLDANTTTFQSAASGSATIDNTQLEFQVRNASNEVIGVYRFTFRCRNILDDDGGVPPAAV